MNMQLGVAGGPVPFESEAFTPELAQQLAAFGLSAIVTHVNPHPDHLPDDEAVRIRSVLADAGIRIVQAGGFRASLVEPDDDLRARGIEELRKVLATVALLGAEMFITGCGSLGAAHFYAPHPANHHEETEERLVDSLRRIAPMAEELDVVFALECHLLTTMNSPQTIRRVLDAVDSTHVKANFDPVNMLGDLPSVYRSGERIKSMVDTVGHRYAKSAHAKDIVVSDEQFPLGLAEAAHGEGHIDFDAFFAACARLGEGVPVIVEHLSADRAIDAFDFMRKAAAQSGVTFDRSPA